MTEHAVEIDRLTKRFRLAHHPTRSLKETTIRLLHGKLTYDSFTALDGVNLTIGQGESVGIIGPNGSGKSTLFKIISGILRPTSGQVKTRGRISPLIELAAGFHPELNGIENIYLNGAIYGIPRAQVATKVDAIAEFAGIGHFIHEPVRVYSSGMMVRLAFALAVNVEADILLIDEVLSVGDAEFQPRCIARIRELKAQGVTIVFVSHDMTAVAAVCDRAVLIERGRVQHDGRPNEVIDHYMDHMRAARAEAGHPSAG